MDNAKPSAKLTREERLAAQLRANLRRRKQQARTLGQQQPAAVAGETADKPAQVKPTLAKQAGDG
ncbi:hypothetical protein [Novosphingobium sp.]|uniref:hypothetical protein n=1 Tax=Novosphingobium sp. TaxID=1874826 RepID=UPI0025EBD0BF|nr:hypothetical protein [Novosphingobium sp.]